ncbi:glycosyltransferase family 90 protein [Diplodia corticola]|uniref:Glycosyltransferase family 90 protein n=1 Tax=Diplodia corticola TaxID=236234 RepID=A0A1J9QYE0_9PEZI|nr:glycosyltransferase family 90 protein [Diplodia corticola]OJD34062.1 glycosyltransferase family 90 protein [Diplodia corticola]
MDRLEPSQGYSSLGLVVCVAYLTSTIETSLVFERPTASWAVILAAVSGLLLLLRPIRLLFSRNRRQSQKYSAIPLNDVSGDGRSSSPPLLGGPSNSQPRSRLKRWLHRAFLAVVLTIRVDMFRRTGSKAAGGSLEALVPFFIALADRWSKVTRGHQHHNRRHEHKATNQLLATKPSSSFWLSPLAYATVFSWYGALAIWYSPSSLASTYISDQQLGSLTTGTPLQIVGAALDVLLAIYVATSLELSTNARVESRDESVHSVGLSFLIATAACLVLGAADSIVQEPAHVFYQPENFAPRIVKIAFAVSFMTFCALHTISHSGALDASLLILCTGSAVTLAVKTWNPPTPFLDAPEFRALIPLGFVVGLILHSLADFRKQWPADAQGKPDRPKRRWSLFHLYGLFFAIQTLLINWGHAEIHVHPVDILIDQAKQQHDTWLKTASASTSLADATRNYVARYNMTPPPLFDKWYEYAINQSSVIIDEFDAIHEDLLPFWSLSPAEIRKRTKEALASPLGIGGIQIRNGVASITGDPPGTHRWALDGVIAMIEKFGEFLPDMDLAFNLNDEPRVSVPYQELGRVREAASLGLANHRTKSPSLKEFSKNRTEGWAVLPDEPLDLGRFITLSFQNTWDFGSAHCPPDSPARTNRHLDPNTFCASCAAPHSSGIFLSNWTYATTDICHQPDLAHLHGFYLSPSAFDPTQHLMPIFSQSKAPGFNDIRYPSPWNYLGKARYDPTSDFPDPPFAAKDPTLFWRGATTEGYSSHFTNPSGAWRGMARQRAVALLTNTSTPQPLLLHSSSSSQSSSPALHYAPIPPATLHSRLSPSALFTSITRCTDPACAAQQSFFAPSGTGGSHTPDFQAHWRHAYLLDLDGAGFSGRFVPFLRSASLPLKSQSLFREWWESRVRAWWHFVPLDLRGQGVWASWAYFVGWEGEQGDGEGRWEGRREVAERLAGEGRRWAGEVLRGVDMEVYLFRVLLEWGRLTDDAREGGKGGGE